MGDMIGRWSPFLSVMLLMGASGEADEVYLEKDGLVAFEVEAASAAEGWEKGTDLKGYSGNCYYTWRGGNQFKKPGQGVLAYRFVIRTEGRYALRLHNRHDFKIGSEENDCFTQMDEGKWMKTFSSKKGQWTWNSRHELRGAEKKSGGYDLSAGVHVFRISGRSNGFSIDRVHLFKEGVKAEDLSLALSEVQKGAPEQSPVQK